MPAPCYSFDAGRMAGLSEVLPVDSRISGACCLPDPREHVASEYPVAEDIASEHGTEKTRNQIVGECNAEECLRLDSGDSACSSINPLEHVRRNVRTDFSDGLG